MDEQRSTDGEDAAAKPSASTATPSVHRPRGSALKFVGLLVAIAAAVWFFRFTETGRGITWQYVRDTIHGYHPFDRLAYVLIYIVGTVILIPGTALSFAGANLFGYLEGTVYTWIGATIGACLAFWVAKLLGRDFVDRLFKGRFEAFDRRISENGFVGLLVVRLLPIFPFNGVNFGAGLTSISFRDYLLATAIGILPGTFVYQFLFFKFGEKMLEGEFRWSYLWDAELLTAVALFVTFALVGGYFAKRFGAVDAQKPASDELNH